MVWAADSGSIDLSSRPWNSVMTFCSSGPEGQNWSLLCSSAQLGVMVSRRDLSKRVIWRRRRDQFFITTAVSKEGFSYCVMGKHESSVLICTVRPYVSVRTSNHHNLCRRLHQHITYTTTFSITATPCCSLTNTCFFSNDFLTGLGASKMSSSSSS